MASISGLTRRVRAFAALPTEVAELSATLDQMNQVIAQMNHIIVTMIPATNHAVAQLNHDVHAGAEDALPLFVGYAERLRLDADTAIGATQVIERQLSELEHAVANIRRDD